ncbi:MAG TPA: ABC transporter ATP-binding protein [Thermomicrobiales bacterium]|nr:ABC transporter ATP-binding protein [Thermomicrobiales bacterium]
MEPLLDVRQLTTDYVAYGGTVRAVDRVDLQVFPGELLGVVGIAAAGKSTLAYSILDLVPPPGRIVGGEVWFEGENLLALSDKRRQQLRGSRIGLIVPDPRRHLNPLMRVGDQIAAVMRAHQRIDKPAARARACDLIAAVGIPDPEWRMRSYPHELSGGMCQRIAIAMAIANDPQLILADEPTAGLDVTVQVQILDLLRDAARRHDAAAMIVTRDLGIVAHYCQRVAVMHEGRIVEIAPTSAFFADAGPVGQSLLRATKLARGETAAASAGGR